MREIRFRLRIKEKDGSITTQYCSLNDFCEDYGLSEQLSVCEILSKDQFTGLKDKKRTKKYPNGQEIYEGDIVERNTELGKTKGKVFFREGWMLQVKSFNKEGDFIDSKLFPAHKLETLEEAVNQLMGEKV